MNIGIDVSAVANMPKAFVSAKKNASRNAKRVSRKAATFLRDRVREHASGRPGPNIITGHYRASIMLAGSEDSADASTTYVSTNAPQAHRLEFGFAGIDSIGRHYAQPPFPHWRPGLQDLANNADQFKGDLSQGLFE